MTDTNHASNDQEEKPATQFIGLSIWDIPTPVPVTLDNQMFYALEGLRSGDPSLLADMIEAGRLDYAARFMTAEDNARLAKALRKAKPKGFLSKSETRATADADNKRNARLLGLICFWYAQGTKTSENSSQKSMFGKAFDTYQADPIPGATWVGIDSIKSHVWDQHLSGKTLAGDNSIIEIFTCFVQGLNKAMPTHKQANQRFIWFGDKFLQRIPPPLPVPSDYLKQLDALIDSKDDACFRYRRMLVDERT